MFRRKIKVSHKAVDVAAVRQFQSETERHPRSARTHGGSGRRYGCWADCFRCVLLLAAFTQMDRVVTNPDGKIVLAKDVLNVYQALDPSIIKTINVREGELVKPGQVIATLDPTFAAADVKQVKLQVASLTAQIMRDEAELSGQDLVFPATDDPDLLGYQKIQAALHEQMMANYKAQIDSFDAQVKTTQATVIKYEADAAGYEKRQQIAKQIEGQRLDLEAKGAGSLFNRLTTQDQRIEMERYQEFDNNSLKEARETLASTKANREAFIKQWQTQISQDLVTQRGNLDAANAQLEKATSTRISWS